MNFDKPIQVGVSEKATNNPPIEILVQNEATLAHLPLTWPAGTVAYTPGRTSQWTFNGGGWNAVAKPEFDIDTPADGEVLIYDAGAGSWKNGWPVLLLEADTVESDTVLSEAWEDIYAAYIGGKNVILNDATGQTAYGLLACYKSGSDYVVEISADEGVVATYVADDADKKPVLQESAGT